MPIKLNCSPVAPPLARGARKTGRWRSGCRSGRRNGIRGEGRRAQLVAHQALEIDERLFVAGPAAHGAGHRRFPPQSAGPARHPPRSSSSRSRVRARPRIRSRRAPSAAIALTPAADDIGDHSAPSGMQRANHSAVVIDQQDRDTIRGQDPQDHVRARRYHAVSHRGDCAAVRIDHLNAVAVHLMDLDEFHASVEGRPADAANWSAPRQERHRPDRKSSTTRRAPR